MKKILCFLLILLVFLPFVFAEKKVLTRTKYLSGAHININNTDYVLKISRTSTDLALVQGTNYTFMEISDCINYQDKRTCYTDRPDNKSAIFTTYDLNGKIKLSMTKNTSVLQLGQERAIEIYINNSGGSTVSDVYFYQHVPSVFKIESIEGCELRGSEIFWFGKVDEDEQHICSYIIIPQNNSKVTMTGNLTYSTFGKNFTLKLDKYDIRSTLPFKYNFSVSPKKLLQGQNFTVKFTIKNNGTKNMSIRALTISDMPFYSRSMDDVEIEYTNDPSIVLKSTKIIKNKTLIINTSLTILEAGNHLIPITLSYGYFGTDGKFDYTTERTFTQYINLTSENPGIRINVTHNDSYLSFSKGVIVLTYHNPNPYMRYTSLNVNLTSELSDLNKVARVKDGGSLSIPMVAPLVSEAEVIPFTFHISYQDSKGKEYEKEISGSVKVLPLGNISISKEIRYAQLNGSKIAQLYLVIDNSLGISVNATFVDDIIADNNSMRKIEENVLIQNDEKKEIFLLNMSYDIVDSFVAIESETTLSFSLSGYNMSIKKETDLDLETIKKMISPKIQINETHITVPPENPSFIDNNKKWIMWGGIFLLIFILFTIIAVVVKKKKTVSAPAVNNPVSRADTVVDKDESKPKQEKIDSEPILR